MLRTWKRGKRKAKHMDAAQWLQAVEWDDAGDPVLAETLQCKVLPVELVA
jgi:hypothetical protein